MPDVFGPQAQSLSGVWDRPGKHSRSRRSPLCTSGMLRVAKSCFGSPRTRVFIGSLAFSPDGKTVATTFSELVVRLWDVATGKEHSPQEGHRS